MCHIVIALAIAAALWPFIGLNGGLACGAIFYVSREFTQWEAGLAFDWKGLAAPLLACTVVYLITRFSPSI